MLIFANGGVVVKKLVIFVHVINVWPHNIMSWYFMFEKKYTDVHLRFWLAWKGLQVFSRKELIFETAQSH